MGRPIGLGGAVRLASLISMAIVGPCAWAQQGHSRPPLAVPAAGSDGAWSAFEADDGFVDDPAKPAGTRLQALEARIRRFAPWADHVAQEHAELKQLIERGKVVESGLIERSAQFWAAARSSTVASAKGEGAARGLAWHCTRAKEIVSQLPQLAAAATALLAEHAAELNGVEVGSAGAPAALQAMSARLQSRGAALLGSGDRRRMERDLEEVELGLPHGAGAQTTIAQMAKELGNEAEGLKTFAVARAKDGDRLEKRIARYRGELETIDEALGRIVPELATDVPVRNDLLERLTAIHPPWPKNDPYDLVTSLKYWAERWERLADETEMSASTGVGWLPCDVKACGSWTEPARDFADARAAAGRPLQDQLVRLDELHAARSRQLEQARKKAAQVIQDNQTEVIDLDAKLAKVKERGAQVPAGDQAGQQKLRSLLDKGSTLRREAEERIAQMRRADAALAAEARALADDRAAARALGPRLLGFFQPDAGE